MKDKAEGASDDARSPLTPEERKLRGALIDYVWHNCAHNEGEGYANWLVCRSCAVRFMARERCAAEARRDAQWREALLLWSGGSGLSMQDEYSAPLRKLWGSVATEPKAPSSSPRTLAGAVAERPPDPEGAVLRDSTHSEER